MNIDFRRNRRCIQDTIRIVRDTTKTCTTNRAGSPSAVLHRPCLKVNNSPVRDATRNKQRWWWRALSRTAQAYPFTSTKRNTVFNFKLLFPSNGEALPCHLWGGVECLSVPKFESKNQLLVCMSLNPKFSSEIYFLQWTDNQCPAESNGKGTSKIRDTPWPPHHGIVSFTQVEPTTSKSRTPSMFFSSRHFAQRQQEQSQKTPYNLKPYSDTLERPTRRTKQAQRKKNAQGEALLILCIPGTPHVTIIPPPMETRTTSK